MAVTEQSRYFYSHIVSSICQCDRNTGLAQENINFKTKGLLSEIPRQNTGIKKSLRSYQPVGSLSQGNRFKTILSRLHINGKGRSCWKIFYGVSIDQSNQGNRHCILIFKRQPSYVLGDFYYSSSYADVLLPLLVSVLWFWKYFWNIRESQWCFIKEGWIVWTILGCNNLLVWTSFL